MDFAVLIRQLQGLTNGERHVSGLVNTSGPVQTGTGFSVVRNGVGDVTITFDVAFKRQISIVAMAAETSGARSVKIKDGVPTTTTTARLQVYSPDAPFAAAESIFCFIAQG